MKTKRFLAVATLTAATLGVTACTPALKLTPSDASVVLAQQALNAPDPGQPGRYDVLTLYYGSGTDKNRDAYRDSVTITTEPVDASKLVSLGGSASERNDYWGFTPKEMPLNARVWYPGVTKRKTLEKFTDNFILQNKAKGYKYVDHESAWKSWLRKAIDDGSIQKEPAFSEGDY